MHSGASMRPDRSVRITRISTDPRRKLHDFGNTVCEIIGDRVVKILCLEDQDLDGIYELLR